MKERIVNALKNFFRALHTKKVSLPKEAELNSAIVNLSTAERAFLWVCITALAGTTGFFFFQLNNLASVEVPRQGGEMVEGIVGAPRYINPLLARSKADKNLAALIYSGLMKYEPEKGLTTDLAKNYTVSKDGLAYTFTLKKDIYFHDGEPITAEDVVFTVQKAKDPAIENPKRSSWDGIKVKKINERKVQFTLKQPYVPFIHNTTLGILPKHIWGKVPPNRFSLSRFNIQPVGSGTYKVENIRHSSSGLASAYELTSFHKYTGKNPYIESVTFKFYSNTSSLLSDYRKGQIDNIHGISAGKSDSIVQADSRILHTPLPRIFGVFFNQNRAEIFTNSKVRRALKTAVNKEKIVDRVFNGYATPLKGPIPSNTLDKLKISKKEQGREASNEQKATSTKEKSRIKKAKEILSSSGWEFNKEKDVWQKGSGDTKRMLSFSISTSDLSELTETARSLKETWEKLGAKVEIKTFKANDLNQNVIRPRDYETLLFGEVVGRGLDLYPFWHSSKQSDPGLNVAMYANITADKLLEETRKTLNPKKRAEKYQKFLKEIETDQPAVFLYSPHFIYLLDRKIKNVYLSGLANSSERFMNIENWYIKTNKIWEFLVD